jgi:integrase
MKGHLRERSPGKWAIIIDLGRKPGGRRRQKWFSFRGTKRQAQLELAKKIASRDTLPDAGKLTLGAYLDKWVDEQRVGARAFERYRDVVRKNIIPDLGHVALAKLTGDQISTHYTKQLANGRRDGSGGLSPASVRYQHVLLGKALKQAVVRGLLARNPIDSVEPPHIEKAPMRTLDLDQAAKVLEDARATRLFVPALLALTCGLRRGEIVALRWRNVDLEAATLTVSESMEQTADAVRIKRPKNGRGRVIALPRMAVTELKKHRAQQESELEAMGGRLTRDSLVYTKEDGEPMQPRSLTHAWDFWSKGRKPRVRFHDLRHAHATHLLASGVHPKVAQERLGHSSVAVTMDIYSHVLPGMQEDAARKVGDALRAAMVKSRDEM